MDMVIKFWGVRGTLPVPGKKTIRYGGNTNCVTLHFGKKSFFIFDAGTGIKELSNYLVKHHQLPINAKIFITHPHYDHINGIPFFSPLYMKGNQFEILGQDHNGIKFEELISRQMDRVYFPVTVKEFGSKIKYSSLKEDAFYREGLRIETFLLNHPGNSIGYRIQDKNKSFCYITDNELYLENSPHYRQSDVDRLVKFIQNTDVLVIDSTYTDNEYQKKTGWGHSCVSRTIDIADKAGVKLVCLYHHDPNQTDKDIDAKLKKARAILKVRRSKTQCIAPREGQKLII